MVTFARYAILAAALLLGACQTAKRPDPQIVLADTDRRLTMQVVGGMWENTIRHLQRQGGEQATLMRVVRAEPDLVVIRRNSGHGYFGAGRGHILIEFTAEQTGPDTALRTRIVAVQNPDSQGNGRVVPIDDAYGWFPDAIKDWIAAVLLDMQGVASRASKPDGIPVVVGLGDDVPLGATVMPAPARGPGVFRVDLGAVHGACEGVSSGGDAPNARGTWSIECAKGLRANGAFAMDAKGELATGDGVASDGRKVTYRFGPVRR